MTRQRPSHGAAGRAAIGTALTLLAGALINYATDNAWWWLVAGPCGVAVISTDYYRQTRETADRSGADTGSQLRPGRHRRPASQTKARPIMLLALILTVAGSVPAVMLRGAQADRPATGWEVRTDPANYTPQRSSWSNGRPVYEPGPDAASTNPTHAYVHGGGAGSFTYSVMLKNVDVKAASLAAYLSSDEPRSRTADSHSDVTLVVNGADLPAQRVRSEDGAGRRYEWIIEPQVLREGPNLVEFRVDRSGESANGLCIYGKSLGVETADRWITLRMS